MVIMMSLTETLRTIGAGFSEVCAAYHYRRPDKKEAPYLVWQEDGEGEIYKADNAKFTITLDLECSRDIGLVRMYAAWLYRARGLTDPAQTAMPRMLRFALNNRKVREVVDRADP